MSKIYDELVALIESQQKGKENTDVFMVGEQLKYMVRGNDHNAEILLQDIAMKEMNLVAAAAKLKDYADKNRKGAKCFCIAPIVAYGILCEFYGLQRKEHPIVKEPLAWTEIAPAQDSGFIDLGDFL